MIATALLAEHAEVIPELRRWFEAEWPAYYGAGGRGDAGADLRSFARRDALPLGVVAFRDGILCGVAALKAESISSHRHLTPWIAAGLVEPAMRGRGIGTCLLGGVQQQARRLGFDRVHCATATAETLLEREGFRLLERVLHEGEKLGVYVKRL